jgi:hypothetical protein
LSPDLVRAGYASKRRLSPQEAALVIEMLRDEVRTWASRYSRLWCAVDDYLRCLPGDKVRYGTRLKQVAGKRKECRV